MKLTKKDLEDIYSLLLMSGTGRSPTEMMFLEDEIFDKYFKWEKEGINILEIANRLQDEWKAKNPNANLNDFDHFYHLRPKKKHDKKL